MMYTTLKKLLAHLGKTKADDEPLARATDEELTADRAAARVAANMAASAATWVEAGVATSAEARDAAWMADSAEARDE